MMNYIAILTFQIMFNIFKVLEIKFTYDTKKGFEWKLDKYESKEDLLDAVYEQFWDIMEEHNIRLDDIIN